MIIDVSLGNWEQCPRTVEVFVSKKSQEKQCENSILELWKSLYQRSLNKKQRMAFHEKTASSTSHHKGAALILPKDTVCQLLLLSRPSVHLVFNDYLI